MSFRAWLFISVIGLTFSPISLQAQEHAENEAGNAEGHQPPTLPFVIPVNVIEDDASAEASQRSEEESRQREKDDLIAQQGMNVATQAMNEATQSMKRASWLSTILVGIGTGLLIWTLVETRRATKAASDGTKIAERALIEIERPWVLANGVRFMWGVNAMPGDFHGQKGFIPYIVFQNYGRSPAFDVKLKFNTFVAEANSENITFGDILIEDGEVGTVTGPGHEGGHQVGAFWGQAACEEILTGAKEFYVHVVVEYRVTENGKLARTEQCYRAIPRPGEGNLLNTESIPYGNKNRAT